LFNPDIYCIAAVLLEKDGAEYLLAKELAYDVVTGQTDKLTAALAKTSGKDIVQFAKAVEISAPKIDEKVCATKDREGGSGNKYGVYGATTDDSSTYPRARCGAAGHNSQSGSPSTPQVLHDFAEKTLLGDGSKNWPTSSGTGTPKPETNDNAKAVAGDLTKLNSDEKTIVAGLLAKTIEGGEVVEIRAVSSTFTKT
ncbi:P44-66 outer membrane protein, partial [Anaplasma phagocytophilum str. HGE1]